MADTMSLYCQEQAVAASLGGEYNSAQSEPTLGELVAFLHLTSCVMSLWLLVIWWHKFARFQALPLRRLGPLVRRIFGWHKLVVVLSLPVGWRAARQLVGAQPAAIA